MSGCPFNHEPVEGPDGGSPPAVGPATVPDTPAPAVESTAASAESAESRERGMSRRGLFSLAGVGGAGAVAGLAAGYLSHDVVTAVAAPASTASNVVPFYGERQAGIVTPAQDRLHMAAFDVTIEDRDAVIQLLKDWTAAAEAMTTGRTTGGAGAVDGPYDAPPEDTGEALDLAAGKLTLTFGFGPGLFERDGKPRFGLEGVDPTR